MNRLYSIEFRFFNPVMFFHVKVTNTMSISTRQWELSCSSHLAQPVGSLFCYILAVKKASSKYLNCDTCWYMLHYVRQSPPFLFQSFQVLLNLKIFSFLSEKLPISCKICGMGFDCIFVVVIKLLVCFIVVIEPHWLVECQQFSIWCWLSFPVNSDICKVALADEHPEIFSNEQ